MLRVVLEYDVDYRTFFDEKVTKIVKRVAAWPLTSDNTIVIHANISFLLSRLQLTIQLDSTLAIILLLPMCVPNVTQRHKNLLMIHGCCLCGIRPFIGCTSLLRPSRQRRIALECHLSVTRSSVFAAFWWTKRWWGGMTVRNWTLCNHRTTISERIVNNFLQLAEPYLSDVDLETLQTNVSVGYN